MRTRLNDWIDTETGDVKLGIDVSKNGKKWFHFAINNKPYFAKSESAREEMRKELRKKCMP